MSLRRSSITSRQKNGSDVSLVLQPITYSEACDFIAKYHRHHLPPQGWKFGMAVNDGKAVVGVVTIGRPVSRHQDDGVTLEVTRCCTDGTRNACSMLYGAAWRAVKAMGYRRLITYTLASESGGSLKGSGWRLIGERKSGTWNSPSRPRVPQPGQPKLLWEAAS